jgi:hypothetical protein
MDPSRKLSKSFCKPLRIEVVVEEGAVVKSKLNHGPRESGEARRLMNTPTNYF